MGHVAAREILEVVEAIYEATGAPQQWSNVAERCRHLIPGSSFCLIAETTAAPGNQLAIASGWDPDYVASYAAYYHTTNTYQELLARIPPGQVSVASRLVDPAWRDKQQFFQEWLRPAGNYTHGASVWLVRGSGGSMRLSYDLPTRRARLEPRAGELLERLKSHFTRALELQSVLGGAIGAMLPTDALLEQIDEASILVDADARIVGCNARATALLQRDVGASDRTGRLVFAGEPADQAFRAAVASATSTIEVMAPAAFFVDSRDGRRQRAIVLPLRQNAALPSFVPRHRLALVLIDDGSSDSGSPVQLLGELFKLTAAESRLVISLLDGGTLAETADRIGIARATARNHLASAMSKLGVKRQTEVVRVVSMLAPRLRLGPSRR